MKCGNPKCKSKKQMLIGISHGLFGHVCPECNEELKAQELEVQAKIRKLKRGSSR